MHESTMTTDELDALQRHVFDFFRDHKTERMAVSDAAKHFESLGYTLTRPIEDTLQVYGVVERPDDGEARRRWPFPPMEGAWGLEVGVLVPTKPTTPRIRRAIWREFVASLPGGQRAVVGELSRTDGPITVEDLCAKVFLPQSTVSTHLRSLRAKGIVSSEKQGRFCFYEITDQRWVR